jgi:hypothetical protein
MSMGTWAEDMDKDQLEHPERWPGLSAPTATAVHHHEEDPGQACVTEHVAQVDAATVQTADPESWAIIAGLLYREEWIQAARFVATTGYAEGRVEAMRSLVRWVAEPSLANPLTGDILRVALERVDWAAVVSAFTAPVEELTA